MTPIVGANAQVTYYSPNDLITHLTLLNTLLIFQLMFVNQYMADDIFL